MKFSFFCLGLAATVWAVASSVSFVAPVQSFLSIINRDAYAFPQDEIWTNSTVLALVTNIGLWWRGDERRAQVLPDDPDILEQENQWILWGSGFEASYPIIREQRGYANIRSFYPSPSFRLSAQVRAVRSPFTTVSILRTGYYPLPLPDRVTTGNVAPLSKISTSPSDERVSWIADYAWLTAVCWRDAQARVMFELPVRGALSVYGLGGVYHRGYESVQPIAWSVEVSDSGEDWTILDERVGSEISTSRGHINYFEIGPKIKGSYIRITFVANPEQDCVGLTEIELFLHPSVAPE